MARIQQDSAVRIRIGGGVVDVIHLETALAQIMASAKRRASMMVAFCNVHVLMTAEKNSSLHRAIAGASLCLPDGAPVAWFIRRVGFCQQRRISGPDFVLSLCDAAAREGEGVFLFGSSPETLRKFERSLHEGFPALRISGSFSPPFRPLTEEEDAEVVDEIERSGAGIVLVGLGCPKQEVWMADHLGSVKAVMLGVGAAFDFHAGTVMRAPVWMRERGLEWLHRLWKEPRRLFGRYFTTNSRFIVWVGRNWHRRTSVIVRTLQ